ncbi:MAG: hypothetical protein ACRDRS_23970 [Pseudonocardiaceae bacterium]
MSGDAATAPVGAAPRWDLSPSDWHAHAVDEDAEHPDGVSVARCGQRLLGTSLYEQPPPGGWMCLACARWTERGDDTGEVTEPPPAPSAPAGARPRDE